MHRTSESLGDGHGVGTRVGEAGLLPGAGGEVDHGTVGPQPELVGKPLDGLAGIVGPALLIDIGRAREPAASSLVNGHGQRVVNCSPL